MHKVTFSERRSGKDRRQGPRRALRRRLADVFRIDSNRRRCRRRAPYIRGETYTVFEPDRL